MRTIATIIRLLIILALTWGKLIANPYPVNNWYILSLGGKPVGYYHETITLSGHEVKSAVEMLMRISRLGSEAIPDSRQVFNEDLQGNLQSVQSELLFSKEPSVSTAYIRQGVIHVVNEAGGKASSADVSYTGALSGNEGIRLLTLKTLNQVGDSLAYQVFIPDFGGVFKGVRKHNAGLGISMKTLAGFTFGSPDKVYPESILFSMDNDQAGL